MCLSLVKNISKNITVIFILEYDKNLLTNATWRFLDLYSLFFDASQSQENELLYSSYGSLMDQYPGVIPIIQIIGSVLNLKRKKRLDFILLSYMFEDNTNTT